MSVQNIPSPAPSQGGAAQRARIAGRNLARSFSPMRHDYTFDVELSDGLYRLVGVLLYYAQAKTSCWPCNATLAIDLGIGRRMVQLRLRALEAAGIVACRRDPTNPTGRTIDLLFRMRPIAPEAKPTGAQFEPYSQGLPRAQSKTPQGQEREIKGLPSASPIQRRPNPVDPTSAELHEAFRQAGRFDYPRGHRLRVSAENAVASVRARERRP